MFHTWHNFSQSKIWDSSKVNFLDFIIVTIAKFRNSVCFNRDSMSPTKNRFLFPMTDSIASERFATIFNDRLGNHGSLDHWIHARRKSLFEEFFCLSNKFSYYSHSFLYSILEIDSWSLDLSNSCTKCLKKIFKSSGQSSFWCE